MKALSLVTDLTIPIKGKQYKIKKDRLYIYTESFIKELLFVYGDNIINDTCRFESLYRPYCGENLNGKILFCFRSSGIGDYLAVSVALRCLKKQYPDCKIIFGSEPLLSELVSVNPDIDKFVQLPYPADILKTADYVLQFQGLIEGNTQESREINFYDLFLSKSFVNPDSVEIEDKRAVINIPENINKDAEIFINSIRKLMRNDLLVGLQVRTSSLKRDYPISYIGNLISKLDEIGITVLLLISPKDSDILKMIDFPDGVKVWNSCVFGNTILKFASLIDKCDFIISPDTSALHIAGAMQKPMIGLFGAFKSELRIKYFENAIGVDSKINCSPCFKHGSAGCKFSGINTASPCMQLFTPEVLCEIVKKEMLPLFNKNSSAIIPQNINIEGPESDVSKRLAIVTLAISDDVKEMLEISKPFFLEYAKKVNADFIIIDKEIKKITGFPHLEKFQLYEILNEYDRVIYFDVDIIINRNCPNLFDIVPEDHIGIVPDCQNAMWGNINRLREIKNAQNDLGDINWSAGYFNSGVMVLSKCHRNIFEKPEDRLKMECQFRDQTLLNYNVQKYSHSLFILDKKFNGMEITGFSSRINPQNKTDAFVMHFAHEGDKVIQMKKIAELLNKDFSKEKYLFYDLGELGWSLYLMFHINFLLKKIDMKPEQIYLCTSQEKFVLYRDLNINFIDIPDNIKKFMSGLDFDGTHLYDHKTNMRIKNDRLYDLLKNEFPEYYVYEKVGKFIGESIPYTPKPSEESLKYVKDTIAFKHTKRLIIVFPRYRIGKFSHRNLPKDFYIKLCNKLCSEKENLVISIGVKTGSYILSDECNHINFIDFVRNELPVKKLDLLLALCNQNIETFAIGSQSSLPKISLLCNVRTFMIGHEEDRHKIHENWMKTECMFMKTKDSNSYGSIDIVETINKFLSFIH